LPAEQRREVVSYVALLAGSMFQIATPPPPLADIYRREPKLGHSLLDLDARLTRAAASRSPASPPLARRSISRVRAGKGWGLG